MVLGSGSRLVPALIVTNLWILALLLLSWNHSSQYEIAQYDRNVDQPLFIPPERMVAEKPPSCVHHTPGASDLSVPTQPVGFPKDPNLPAFCPECGQGDILCAKYGSVSTLCIL